MLVLIDGHKSSRKRLTESLRRHGYRVRAYASLRGLPPLATMRHLAALVIRCELPVDAALAFADLFHVAYPSAPILLLTPTWWLHLARETGASSLASLHQQPVDDEEINTLMLSCCEGGTAAFRYLDSSHVN